VGCAVPMSPKIICSSSTHWRTAFNMVGASWVGLGWVVVGRWSREMMWLVLLMICTTLTSKEYDSNMFLGKWP
jgi:hypothetical protein